MLRLQEICFKKQYLQRDTLCIFFYYQDGPVIAIDFPPKTFSDGKTYRVKLTGSTSHAKGSSTTELKINSAPRDGFCEATSIEGTP